MAVHGGDGTHAPGGLRSGPPDRPPGRRRPPRQPGPCPQREHPRGGLHQHRQVDVPGVGAVWGRLAMQKLTDKLFTVKYNEDTGRPHIEITDQDVCATRCEGKYCTHFCPAGVYEWTAEQKRTRVTL